MKKILSIVLSILVVFSCTTIVLANETTVEKIIDHVVYEIVNDTVNNTVYYRVKRLFDTYEHSFNATELKVAKEIDGISVTEIGDNACEIEDDTFVKSDESYYDKMYQNVTTIVLPDSITSIGEYAFNYFNKVITIELPENLERIDTRAFQHLDSLKSITIPKSVNYLGEGVFSLCKNLEEVVVLSKITYLPDWAFYGCEKLNKITLSPTIKVTYEETFAKTGFETFNIREGLELGASTFYNNKKLKKVVYEGKSNKKDELVVYYSNFAYCKNLKTVVLPKRVKNVKVFNKAFENCKNLERIYNSENITFLGKNAFKNCKSLKSFMVSKKMKNIPKYAFLGCEKLKKVEFKGKIPTISKNAFKTKNNIKFYVKNKRIAKSLKKQLKKSGAKKPQIYIAKKLYK